MSEKAVLVTTVTTLDLKEFQETIDSIIEYIIKCNTQLEYVNYGGDHQKTLNCQDFVLQLLGVMNLELKWKDDVEIYRFMNTMRKSGKCLMITKRFGTRSEVENFIHESAMANPEYMTGPEYRLLRATAEAMELKYRKYKDRLSDLEGVLERCDWEIKMLTNTKVLSPDEQKELRKLQKVQAKAKLGITKAQTMCRSYGVA